MRIINSLTKYSLALLISGLISQAAFGQSIAVRGAAISEMGWPHKLLSRDVSVPFAPLSSDVAISYFDPAAPTHSWLAPSNWGFVLIGFTERITLASDSGYVDSVRIVFDSISGDSVAVVLDPDTVVQTQDGRYFHFDATVFNTSLNPYADAEIYPSQLGGHDTVTIPFDHAWVPKDFHVTLIPSFSQLGPTSAYSIRGDSEAPRLRDADNCHSTFIGIVGQNYYTGVLDSSLVPNGDNAPIFSNLYITAYTSSAPAAVTRLASTNRISIFPDPASTFLNVQDNGAGANSIDILDLLGRTVLTARIDHGAPIDISRLEPGRYEAIVHCTNATLPEPIVISR